MLRPLPGALTPDEGNETTLAPTTSSRCLSHAHGVPDNLPNSSSLFMKSMTSALRRALGGALLLSALAAQAQNVAIVNGRPVPKARVEALMNQVQRSGQQLPEGAETRVRDEVVLREIFAQEAQRRGVAKSASYREQMELARQSILIRELFEGYKTKNPVSDADAQVEYDKVKAQNSGTEYRASHILVGSEDEAKALIAKIKGGAKFEELAKTASKDPGSGERGGDLDFARPEAYVPEFSQAMTKLQKGQMTEAPVQSQFGWHIIRLDDQREAAFPAFDEVKGQLKQRMEQTRLQAYQEKLKSSAKTDYKFN